MAELGWHLDELMKVINVTVSILLVLLLSVCNCYAQSLSEQPDVTKILIEKAGQLEKLLKEANAQNTTKLSLISNSPKASLNEKDLLVLSKMSQLEELYIKVDIADAKYLAKYDVISNKQFPNLKTLGVKLKKAIEHLDYTSEYPSGFSVFNLRAEKFEIDGIDHYAFTVPKNVKFDNLFIASEPTRRRNFSEKKTYGDLDNGIQNWLTRFDYHVTERRINSPATIRSIHVKDIGWLDVKDLDFNPAIIYVDNNKYLANYNSKLSAEDKKFTQYQGILPMALMNSHFSTIKLPDSQKIVPEDFFRYVTADKVDLGNVIQIEKDAFREATIKELIIPASIQTIDGQAFSKENVRTVIMKGEYAPSISGWCGFKDVQFIIPSGSKKNYELGAWKEVAVLEDGAKTEYSFTIDMPGIISAYLTKEIVGSVVSLKIRGLIDSDDIEYLKKCLNLKKLDLSEAFIIYSQNKANNKQSVLDALYNDFMDEVEAKQIQPSNSCKCPDLKGVHLEELILPEALKKVLGIYLPSTLTKLILPPNAKEIEMDDTNIKELILPASTEYFEIEYTSPNLRVIDMSACTNPKIYIKECSLPNLQTIRMPKYNNKNSRIGGFRSNRVVNIYFQDRELPDGFGFDMTKYNVKVANVYIPKGTRAGYGKVSGYNIVEQ